FEGGGGGSANATSEVVMGPTEASIYKLLDGSRSISTLMEMTGLSDFDVCRTLFDFIDRNLVAPAGQEQAKTSAEPGRRGPAPAPGEGRGTIALAAVLALSAVGLLVSAATPFRVPASSSLFHQEAPAIQASRDMARMQRVAEALRIYCLTFGNYPASLDDLVNASPSLLAPPDLVATNGERFRYQTVGGRVVIEAPDASGEPYLSIAREILPREVTLGGAAPIGSSSP
ncbi:MAG: hypothetical protein ACRD1Z_22320, partial [Vicinamibacteria bacterium]